MVTGPTVRGTTIDDSPILARLISESNKDVATRFGLNARNYPKHPSFCSAAWVKVDLARGEVYFILEHEGGPVACVAFQGNRMNATVVDPQK